MSFDARHPEHANERHLPQGHFAPTKLAPELLAKVGEANAIALFDLQRRLAALGPLPAATQTVLDAAIADLRQLELLGLQVQGIARVLGGDGQAQSEPIDLAAAARATLAEWAGAAAKRGIALQGPTEPMPIDAVAGVVEQLLDLAIDYALRIGCKVAVQVGREGMPAHPMVTVNIERAPGIDAGSDEFNDLQWLLFSTLARASGLSPQRLAVGNAVVLMLGFPPRDASDVPLRSAALLPRTPLAVDRPVLLIEPDERTRVHAHRLLAKAGMRVDTVATVEQAGAALRQRTPDLLIIGLSSDDPACAALIDELRTRQPRLRVIELVDDDSAFAVSLPGAGQAGRVGRGVMDRTLLQAVSQEIDVAWAGAAA